MARVVLIARVAEVAVRHRVVEDEARAADEVARRAVVDAAVVLEEMKEAAGRIARVGRVEGERVAHVREQEVAAAEVDRAFCWRCFRDGR